MVNLGVAPRGEEGLGCDLAVILQDEFKLLLIDGRRDQQSGFQASLGPGRQGFAAA